MDHCMNHGGKNPDGPGLGIDLGGTKMAGALFLEQGMVSPRKVLFLEKRTGKQVMEQMVALIRSFLEGTPDSHDGIRKIGVAVPGIYYQSNGRVWAPNIPGWEDYPLLEELQEKLGKVHISIDSDRACHILGETWKGAAKGCKHAIFLAVGTGIGAGILIDGKVLRGADDIAGSTGWMALTDPFLAGYKKYGCFEYHASGPGLGRMAEEMKFPGPKTASDIFTAFREGNPLAKKVIFQAIRFWGKASANLVSLFNPEKIIFGGGVFGPATQFLHEIYEEAKKWAQPLSIQHVTFEPSKLGSDAGLYGAGFLSMDAREIC
jgi:glucokinase